MAAFGFLAAPALVLPDPSRHLVTLALATALSAGLAALWGARPKGHAALSLFSVCLVLFALELSGTIALSLKTTAQDLGPERTITRPTPGELGWRRARLEQGRQEREAHWNRRCYDGQTISINSYGFRGRDFSLEKPGNVFRVLMTGGSVAFGTPGGGDGFTLQGQLERRLNRLFGLAGTGRQAEIYNLGLPALTSVTELSILVNLLETRPDLVIMFSGWNDLVFSHEPGYYAEGQIGLLAPGCSGEEVKRRTGWAVDQTAFGARHTATISRSARQLLLLIHERVSDSSRGYRWLTGLGRNLPRAPVGQAPGTMPREAEADLAAPGSFPTDKGVERFLANVDRARLLTESQGGRFLLAVQPFRYCGPSALGKNQGARMETIRRSYLNLLERLRGQDRIKWVDTTLESDLMEVMDSFYDSCHFDDEGYALASENVWQSLLSQELVQPLEGVSRLPLKPAGEGGQAAPWALSLGKRSEAVYKVKPGNTLVLEAKEAPQGRVFLLTALGGPPWAVLSQKTEIPFRVELVQADGTETVLAQGVYPAGPGRAESWQDIRVELDRDDLAEGSIRLIAGGKSGPYENLYWQKPVLVALEGSD